MDRLDSDMKALLTILSDATEPIPTEDLAPKLDLKVDATTELTKRASNLKWITQMGHTTQLTDAAIASAPRGWVIMKDGLQVLAEQTG